MYTRDVFKEPFYIVREMIVLDGTYGQNLYTHGNIYCVHSYADSLVRNNPIRSL